jgi:hypothetical protein
MSKTSLQLFFSFPLESIFISKKLMWLPNFIRKKSSCACTYLLRAQPCVLHVDRKKVEEQLGMQSNQQAAHFALSIGGNLTSGSGAPWCGVCCAYCQVFRARGGDE